MGKVFLFVGLPLLVMVIAVGCNDAPQQGTKTRVVTVSTPFPEVQPEPPKPSPEPAAAPAPSERPFYGKSFFDEVLTSVYFYPNGAETDGTPNAATTHLKFSHREDDLWLCGDQRRSFEPGARVRMTVTFEPNQECVTNWQIK